MRPPWQLTPEVEHGLTADPVVGLLVFFGCVDDECLGVVVVGLLLGWCVVGAGFELVDGAVDAGVLVDGCVVVDDGATCVGWWVATAACCVRWAFATLRLLVGAGAAGVAGTAVLSREPVSVAEVVPEVPLG